MKDGSSVRRPVEIELSGVLGMKRMVTATITIKCHLMIDTGSPHPRGGNELKYCGQVNYKLNNRARCAASRHRPQVECEFQTKIERIKGGRADAALET
jgi:hypothetical protein